MSGEEPWRERYSEALGDEGDGTMVEDFAVQIGLPEILIGLAVIALMGLGVWKLAKLLWATFSG